MSWLVNQILRIQKKLICKHTAFTIPYICYSWSNKKTVLQIAKSMSVNVNTAQRAHWNIFRNCPIIDNLEISENEESVSDYNSEEDVITPHLTKKPRKESLMNRSKNWIKITHSKKLCIKNASPIKRNKNEFLHSANLKNQRMTISKSKKFKSSIDKKPFLVSAGMLAVSSKMRGRISY